MRIDASYQSIIVTAQLNLNMQNLVWQRPSLTLVCDLLIGFEYQILGVNGETPETFLLLIGF